MFFVFYFIKISKFALPGVMLIYERTSKDRKKERREKQTTFVAIGALRVKRRIITSDSLSQNI